MGGGKGGRGVDMGEIRGWGKDWDKWREEKLQSGYNEKKIANKRFQGQAELQEILFLKIKKKCFCI